MKNRKFLREPETQGSPGAPVPGKLPLESLPGLPQPPQSVAHLTPVLRAGSGAASKSRDFPLVLAELRLMLSGHAWWWYAVAGALLIACLGSPLADARSTVLAFAWIWPVLLWSRMGTREAQFSTGALVFSAPRAIPRQFLASYAAGVLVTALTGFGLALHLLFVGDLAGLAAWVSGALFIPSLALALGVLSSSRKLFEALYTAWWYVGPVHHVRGLDFMGTTPESSTPAAYLAATALLLLTAYLWRKVKLAHA